MMKLFTKGQLIKTADYDNARYLYALCGTNLVTFRIYKMAKTGEINPLWQATNEGLNALEHYIFEFSSYVDKSGVTRYVLYNIRNGGVKIDDM